MSTGASQPIDVPSILKSLVDQGVFKPGTRKYAIAELILKGEKDLAKVAEITKSSVKTVRNVTYDLKRCKIDEQGAISPGGAPGASGGSPGAGQITGGGALEVAPDGDLRQPAGEGRTQHMPITQPLRLVKPSKPSTSGNMWEQSGIPYLQAFQMLESGASPGDIMSELGLDPDTMLLLMQKYNLLRAEYLKRRGVEALYIPVWYVIAKTLGESVREGCSFYQDDPGVCTYWDFRDVDPDLRRKYPGIFETHGNKMRGRVGEHPELCALCNRAAAFKIH